MKLTYCFSLILGLSINLKGQSADYLIIRDSIVIYSCGKVDIEIVYETREKLFNLDTSVISNNIYQYYKDIAGCYFKIWGKTKDIKDAYLAIDYNKKSIIKNPEYNISYWDIAFIYYFIGECKNGDDYLEQYKKKTDESNWDLDQFKQLKEICANKN